jgi:hypothetical protein
MASIFSSRQLAPVMRARNHSTRRSLSKVAPTASLNPFVYAQPRILSRGSCTLTTYMKNVEQG